MGKGNIVGKVNNPNSNTANGVWSSSEQYEARREGNWPAANTVVVLNRGTATSNTDTVTSATFAGVSIGSADPDRVLLIAITAQSTSPDIVITGVTVNGSPATIVRQATGGIGSDSGIVGLASIPFPSGTTATVVVSFSGNVGNSGVVPYSISKLISSTALSTANAATRPTSTGIGNQYIRINNAIDFKVDGYTIVAAMSRSNPATPASVVNGVTKRTDTIAGGNNLVIGDIIPTVDSSNNSVTVEFVNSADRMAMVSATYR